MAPILSVIILNYNRLEYSRQTIENILKITTFPIELILVDNGSNRDLRDYLLSIKNKAQFPVKYVFSKRNLGISGARNKGALASNQKSKALLFVDDDIILPNDYDRLIIEAIGKIKNVGIVGCCVEGIEYPIKNIDGVDIRIKSGNINGACMAFPRNVWKRIGYFQTNFGKYFGDDIDMDFRTMRLGLINVYIVPSGIHLDGGNGVKKYDELKRLTHKETSPQNKIFENNIKEYVINENYYVPYIIPSSEESSFNRFGGNVDDLLKEKRVIIITAVANASKRTIRAIAETQKQKIANWAHVIVGVKLDKVSEDTYRDFIKKTKNTYFTMGDGTKSEIYNDVLFNFIPTNFPCADSVIFVEQSDTLDSTGTEDITQMFDSNVLIGGIYSGFRIIDPNFLVINKNAKSSVFIKEQFSLEGQDLLKKIFLTSNPFLHVNAFRIEYLQALGGFNEKFFDWAEYYTYGAMLDKRMVVRINKVLYSSSKDITAPFKNGGIDVRNKSLRSIIKEFRGKFSAKG